MEYVIMFPWDPEACVWIATSEDVPGRVLESGAFDALLGRTRIAVPELLELNHESGKIYSLIFHAERKEGIAL